ncbi:MAG: alkaline phosphatase family protein [Balneolaceae bacterium]|nr:alkaline phosphatase family protein [Balneolaceae bacterium]
MSVLFIFIDGVGIGENSTLNPLASENLHSFSYFTSCMGVHIECEEVKKNGILFKKTDANLDVEGLPQSGTGQTSLFTGINASKKIGKHFGPFPHSKIKPLLRKKSVFHKAIEMGKSAHFLNAYPDIFFEKSEKRDRWSCTTLMTKSANLRLNRLQDVLEERAITAEIVQSAWRSMLNLDVPSIDPEDAAERALNALNAYDLVLYEYYLTDKAGHAQDREMADKVLMVLDRFLMQIIKNKKPDDTLVICSDHGNIEDLSTKTHTRNPVPLFVAGDTEPFSEAKSILDVTPGILRVLEKS